MSIKKFAGIVDGDIFTIFVIDSEYQGEDGEAGERVIAGLSSQPTFIEISQFTSTKIKTGIQPSG